MPSFQGILGTNIILSSCIFAASSPTPDEGESPKKWMQEHSQYTESTPTVSGAVSKSPRHRTPKSFNDSGKKWGSLKSKFKSASAPLDSELSALVPPQPSPGSPILSPSGAFSRTLDAREEVSRQSPPSGLASAETQV